MVGLFHEDAYNDHDDRNVVFDWLMEGYICKHVLSLYRKKNIFSVCLCFFCKFHVIRCKFLTSFCRIYFLKHCLNFFNEVNEFYLFYDSQINWRLGHINKISNTRLILMLGGRQTVSKIKKCKFTHRTTLGTIRYFWYYKYLIHLIV